MFFLFVLDDVLGGPCLKSRKCVHLYTCPLLPDCVLLSVLFADGAQKSVQLQSFH